MRDGMDNGFYRAFEEIHRGPRDLIKQRARVYDPLVRALVQNDPAALALDLGCGRGEWLELLKELGMSAMGVDNDPEMLTGARDSDLTVIEADFLYWLDQQPDDSLTLVSAFHLVEHLSMADVKTLTTRSLRVLKPGGILIMETPNPENLVVAGSEFYVDPTHVRPIPFKLLAFILRYAGYARTKILRLHEQDEPREPEDITLNRVLTGVSPDYAVVAQKAGDPHVMAVADSFFSREYGVSLDTLARTYDSQNQSRRTLEKTIVAQARQCAALAEARAATADKLAARLQHEADTAAAELRAIYNSLSWRITRPLRWLKSLVVRRVSPAPSNASVLPPMSPKADRVYKDLKNARDHRKREQD